MLINTHQTYTSVMTMTTGPRYRHFIQLPVALFIHSCFCFNGTMNQTTMQNSTTRNDSAIMSSVMTPHSFALIISYTMVLTAGSVGVTLMINVLKSNLRSWTTITFFNLIVVHGIFLLTIPFRVYYYVTEHWDLPLFLCKVVSVMIHLHMHVVFVIYIIILTIHFLNYFKKTEPVECYRRIHAMGFSVGIWSVVIVIGLVILYYYGAHADANERKCFHFGEELEAKSVLGCNVLLSVCTVIVSCVMGCILAAILYSIIKKHGSSSWAQHEFWAQMKNVSLVLIILFCLVPYHLFRLHYVTNHSRLQQDNEVFLALTSITCFDMMLIFAGKEICHRCVGGDWRKRGSVETTS